MSGCQDGKTPAAGAEVEHACDLRWIADQRGRILAAEMRIKEFANEGSRYDGALVDIERQAAHPDFFDEIGRRLPRRDAALDQIEDFPALRRGDAGMGE